MTHQAKPTTPCLPPAALPGLRRRRGFTFTEIMFAVVILGVGFIMIAAIFPVAIRQGQQSAEESVAVTAAQRAIATISGRVTDSLFPPTAQAGKDTTIDRVQLTPEGAAYYPPFFAIGEAYRTAEGTPRWAYGNQTQTEQKALQQWLSLRGDLISTTDNRIGFAVAYARGNSFYHDNGTKTDQTDNVLVGAANSVRMIVIVAQNRLRPTFNDEDAVDAFNDAGRHTKVLRDLRIPSHGNTPDDYNDTSNQFVEPDRAPATLGLKRFTAQFLLGENGGADRVRFFCDQSNMTTPDISNSSPSRVWPMAPGCFIIVADAGLNTGNGLSLPSNVKSLTAANTETTDKFNARANGRVFRLGAEVPDQTYPTFELVPGQDIQSIPRRQLTNASGTVTIQDLSHVDAPPYLTGTDFPGGTNVARVEVLVLGKALQNPVIAFDPVTNPYVGPPMDVAVYTTTVGVKP